jgi:excisionase family DNA binding protein
MTVAEPVSLSVKEAAALVGISIRYAYELNARGELPGAYRMGTRILVHRPTLLAWMARQATKAAS